MGSILIILIVCVVIFYFSMKSAFKDFGKLYQMYEENRLKKIYKEIDEASKKERT